MNQQRARQRERHPFPRAELDANGRLVVTVGRREIAIFAVGGELYAIFNRCPHHQATLSEGTLWGTAGPSAVGELRYDASRPVLRCPWHRYEFDLATGRCVGDPERLRVATYDVRLEGDEVVLYLEPR